MRVKYTEILKRLEAKHAEEDRRVRQAYELALSKFNERQRQSLERLKALRDLVADDDGTY